MPDAIEIDPPTLEAEVIPEVVYLRVYEDKDFDGTPYTELAAGTPTRLCGTEECEVYEYQLVRKLKYTPSYQLTEIEE